MKKAFEGCLAKRLRGLAEYQEEFDMNQVIGIASIALESSFTPSAIRNCKYFNIIINSFLSETIVVISVN